MNLRYLVPRIIRHFLPERLVRFLLLRSVVIKPGLETADPSAAVAQYVEALQSAGSELNGRRVLVFGYGGRFDIGVGLLEAGAAHVALLDKAAPPDDVHNGALALRYPGYISVEARAPRPNPDRMSLIQGDARQLIPPGPEGQFDLVISNSVYEHLDDAAGVTKALATWTRPSGMHIHFVDLRDHYFAFPFEMLKYSPETWRRFLDPSSHHNRLRMCDYRDIFAASFGEVDVFVRARDAEGFARAQSRIRPEFLTGNAQEDAVTLIRIMARGPRR